MFLRPRRRGPLLADLSVRMWRGSAPYWRVAWETSTKNNNLEIGTYGMHTKASPNAITGPTDSHTDWALDFQYDRTIPRFKNDVLSFRGTYIRENSSLA